MCAGYNEQIFSDHIAEIHSVEIIIFFHYIPQLEELDSSLFSRLLFDVCFKIENFGGISTPFRTKSMQYLLSL